MRCFRLVAFRLFTDAYPQRIRLFGFDFSAKTESSNTRPQRPGCTTLARPLTPHDRAKRSLSGKKTGGDSKQNASASAAAAAGSDLPEEAAADSAPAATPRTTSRLASFRNKARSITGRRLSLGSAATAAPTRETGGSGPLSASVSGSGPTSARRSLSGTLSLGSARRKGAGGGFFSMTAKSPEAEGPGRGSGGGRGGRWGEPDREATAEVHVLSPDSLDSGDESGAGGGGRPAEIADDVFVSVGSGRGGAAAFAAPPSPGAE